MNILWLSQLVPYPPMGGVLQRAYHLIHELSHYHTVDLLAFNQQDLMSPFFGDMSQALDVAQKELGTFCRHIKFIPIECDRASYGKHLLALKSLVTKDPYTINWLKSRTFSEQLKIFLSKHDYNLIHFDTISLIPYLKYVTDKPVVLDHHNIESHMLLRRADNEKNSLKQWYFKQEGRRLEAVEKRVCPQFSLNITCSKIDQDRLIELTGNSRVEEVPNGVDTDYFQPDESIEQQQSLIFVGTLSWYPNIEAIRFIAYELWPRIKATIPDVTIDIIGANPPQDIKQVGESDVRFHVHGFVDDVRPYMDKAAVYVCPISDGGGTKLKILDAFAMGKAVVAHPIACEGIHAIEGKHVLFAENADQYLHHIREFLDDEALRYRLGRNARQLIEQEYAYHQIGENLSALYEKCVHSFNRDGFH